MLRMLDFNCGSCHKKFETLAHGDYNETAPCPYCGNQAQRDHSTDYDCAFGGFSDRGVMASDIETYKQHNVTFAFDVPEHHRGNGISSARPNSHSMQCQCDTCGGVRRAHPRTSADVGKDATL